MRLRLTRQARADRNAILDYIGEHSSSGPASLLAAIERACMLISDHPEAGEATRIAGVRSILVSRYPYRMFYSVSRDGIAVIRIRHTSRRPWGG